MADSIISLLIKGRDQASKEVKKVNNSLKELKSSAVRAAGALAAAIGAKEVIGGIVRTNMEFDKLEAQLSTFTSSAAEAAAAMKLIQDFTQETPFQIQEVTTAFTRLIALGLTPTKEALKAYGDVAAGTGKSIVQFAEAVADAAVGEFERLKEFGIKASKQGDDVSLTFKGVTTTVKNSAGEIEQALISIGQQNFAGAMTAQMDTMEGSISNMKDSFAVLARTIGEAGLNDAIKSVAGLFKGMAQTVLDNVDIIKSVWIQAGTNIIMTFRTIQHMGELSFLGLELIFRGVVDALIIVWNKFIETMVDGYNIIAEYVPGLEKVSASFGKLETAADITAQKIRDSREEYLKDIKMMKESEQARLRVAARAKEEGMSVAELEEKLKKEAAARQAAAAATKKQAAEQKKLDELREKEKKNIESFNEYVTSIEHATRANDFYVKGQEKELEVIEALEAARKARGQALTAEEEAIVRRAVVHRQTSDSIREDFDKQNEAARDAAEKQVEFFKEAARGMQNAMSDFFFDAMQGKMNDFVGSFKRMIDRMVADFLSSQLMNFLAGGFGETGKLGGFLGDIFRANGGPVSAGKPYIVGERGPEMIVPNFNGTVLTAEQTAGMGGNTVNVNISAMDSQDVRRALEKDRRWLAELVGGTTNTFNLRTT